LFFTHYLLYYILVVAFRHYDISCLMPCHVYSHLLVTKYYIASILVADIFTPRVSLTWARQFEFDRSQYFDVRFNIFFDT
jgi:hypothetical protein